MIPICIKILIYFIENTRMSDLTNEMPSKLTFDQLLSDLNKIPLNDSDVLFSLSRDLEQESSELIEKLEKLVLFKTNIELENNNQVSSEFSVDCLNQNIDTLDKQLNSLQNFVDISKKFLSINNTK
jgi:hypothetical protein